MRLLRCSTDWLYRVGYAALNVVCTLIWIVIAMGITHDHKAFSTET